jgi:hypothetical protein
LYPYKKCDTALASQVSYLKAKHWGGISVEGRKNVYITGTSLTTWGSPLNPHAGNDDAYVAKLKSFIAMPCIQLLLFYD